MVVYFSDRSLIGSKNCLMYVMKANNTPISRLPPSILPIQKINYGGNGHIIDNIYERPAEAVQYHFPQAAFKVLLVQIEKLVVLSLSR